MINVLSVEVFGRAKELAEIEGLLHAARKGRSGGLMIVGEPGMGKTALLSHAAKTPGFTVLSTHGSLVEGHLPFAGLHRLLTPLADMREAIPEPQADALSVALGLRTGPSPDRFLISLALLSLLSEAAEEGPVLVLVDDAHCLDRPSADALSFAASRFDAEGVALLAASRPTPSPVLSGLKVLELGGLDPEACEQLIAARAPHPVADAVRGRIVAETGGHPLALTEIVTAVSREQLAGLAPLPDLLPIGPELERAYAERVNTLKQSTQDLLLLAAIEGEGDLRTLALAAHRAGLDLTDLDPAVAVGLIEISEAGVSFRHPLMRSAVWRSATPARCQRAHSLLAEVSPAERRVWHLAAAALGPDERLAAELERVAGQSRVRSGYAAAARALERAAELSDSDEHRARRLVAAAWDCWLAGLPERATVLMDRAWRLAERHSMVRLLGEIDFQRGSIWLRNGVTLDAYAALMSAVDRLVHLEPELALTALMRAAESATYSGDIRRFAAAARRLQEMRNIRGEYADFIRGYLEGVARAATGPMADALVPLRTVLDLSARTDDPPTLIWGATVALMAGDDALAHAFSTRAVTIARANGAISVVPQALELLVYSELWTGQFRVAGANAAEGLRLATETGQVNCACHLRALLALHAAIEGRADLSRKRAREALTQAHAHGLGLSAAVATWALAFSDLAEGKYAETARRLRGMARAGPGHSHGWITILSAPHYVEAAVLSGDRATAERALAAFEDWAGSVNCAWALALVERCRALMSTGDAVDEHYRAALDLHRRGQRDFERARTALLYGSHLRRHRRRAEARPYLREAAEIFERLGIERWRTQAHNELRAAGETLAAGDTPALGLLTPQQLQIARFIAQGATNREVAAQLFISPRTVDYHLRNIFTKLGITSRAELIRRFPR